MQASLGQRAQAFWHTQRVKRLVRDHLGAGARCLVSVRETVCTDLDCAGPATEIRIVTLGFQEIKALVHKPAAEIVSRDIATMLQPLPGTKAASAHTEGIL